MGNIIKRMHPLDTNTIIIICYYQVMHLSLFNVHEHSLSISSRMSRKNIYVVCSLRYDVDPPRENNLVSKRFRIISRDKAVMNYH